jgi:hypothetical protein
MTVCIAAICDNRSVIGASDRMISSLDLRYEPERPKILPVSSSIVVQYSADAPTARVVFNEVLELVGRRITAEPSNWWTVREVALLWSHCCRRETTRQAEDAILAPLDLDHASFLERQRQLAPELVTRLATALQNYKANSVSAIIAGVDTSGPHIFVARDSRVSCEDHMGFAAVGIGDWHATSRFMFSAHANHRSLEATMWLTYNAKRHAEVAPGVGAETDMFAVLGLGGYVEVGPHVLQKMGGNLR